MTLTYHHHMGTGVQTAEEIDRLLAGTDPVSAFPAVRHRSPRLFRGRPRGGPGDAHRRASATCTSRTCGLDVLERVKRERLSFLAAVKQGVFTVPG